MSITDIDLFTSKNMLYCGHIAVHTKTRCNLGNIHLHSIFKYFDDSNVNLIMIDI